MLNTILSTKYKVINDTDNLCSPRETQNLVGTKQTRYEEKRGKLIHLHLQLRVNFYINRNGLYHSANRIFQWLLVVLNQTFSYLPHPVIYLVIGWVPSYLTSLSISFFICKMLIIIFILQNFCEDQVRQSVYCIWQQKEHNKCQADNTDIIIISSTLSHDFSFPLTVLHPHWLLKTVRIG